MVVAPLGARAFGRFGARNVTTIALLIAALGAATMSLAQVNSTVAPILTTLILVNLAVGLMAAGTTSMVMSAVPPDKAGMASGTQSTTRQLGGALGIALLGSILAARYTANLAHALSGTPAQRYLSTAQRSLGDALEAVPGGGAVQDILTRVSREALSPGFTPWRGPSPQSPRASAVVVFLALEASPSRANDETDLARRRYSGDPKSGPVTRRSLSSGHLERGPSHSELAGWRWVRERGKVSAPTTGDGVVMPAALVIHGGRVVDGAGGPGATTGRPRSAAVAPVSPRPLPVLTVTNRAFWTGGERGELLVYRCQDCGYYVHPPVRYCPKCESRDVDPEPVSGRGSVASFTVNHQRVGGGVGTFPTFWPSSSWMSNPTFAS